MRSETTYFQSPGKKNTLETVEQAVKIAKRRGIGYIVVASGTGRTGVLVAEKATKNGIHVAVVTYQHGFEEKGKGSLEERYAKRLEALGVDIVSATHALSGVERSITKKLGGASRIEAVAEALRSLYGQGMKVCVEIALMAADAGAVPCGDNDEIISVAGTDSGADTAVILKPAHSNSFFDLQVREIIAMPRTR